MDVFATRRAPPPPSNRSSGTQEKCVGCKERQAKLDDGQKLLLRLEDRLREGRNDLELTKRKHAKINSDIRRGHAGLQSAYPFSHLLVLDLSFARRVRLYSRTVNDLQAGAEVLTQERDYLLREAVKREEEIAALRAKNSAVKLFNGELMEMFGRRLVPQSSNLQLKKSLAANSSPLLHGLEARPKVTNADLIRPSKGCEDTAARKSLLPLFQQARRTLPKHAAAAAEAEEEQGPGATTPRVPPKRRGGPGGTAGDHLRTPKRARSELTPSGDHRLPKPERSSAPQTPPRPSHSAAKTRVLNLRPYLPTPGTFDLSGAVPRWRARESVLPKTSRETPIAPWWGPASAQGVPTLASRPGGKKDASDAGVCDDGGYPTPGGTRAATPGPFKI